MPYVLAPRWARILLYWLRAALYGALLVAGVGAVWLTPQTISARLPGALTDIWGAFAVVGALVCLVGAMRRRYRWEMTGLPLVAGAVLIYALTIWDIVPDTLTRLAQAASVTALLLALVIRYVDLELVRRRLLREHQQQHG